MLLAPDQGAIEEFASEGSNAAFRERVPHRAVKTHEAWRVGAEHMAWLERGIAEQGWPGIEMVGERGAEAAWPLTQLADGATVAGT
ncbi:hypothetical protein [Streptomyces sp. NPDC054866]